MEHPPLSTSVDNRVGNVGPWGQTPVLDELWARMLDAAAQRLPSAIIDSWVRPCRLIAIDGDHLRIAAPNPFSRNWLLEHHLDALKAVAQDCIGGNPRISIDVDERLDSRPSETASFPAHAAVAPGTVEGLQSPVHLRRRGPR